MRRKKKDKGRGEEKEKTDMGHPRGVEIRKREKRRREWICGMREV